MVTSPATAGVRDALADDVDFALQAEPRGTGDAVAAALEALPDDLDEILVLTGDVPLLEAAMLTELLEERRLDEAAIALIAIDAVEPVHPHRTSAPADLDRTAAVTLFAAWLREHRPDRSRPADLEELVTELADSWQTGGPADFVPHLFSTPRRARRGTYPRSHDGARRRTAVTVALVGRDRLVLPDGLVERLDLVGVR